MTWHSTKDEMARKHDGILSSLAIRDMERKTTMRRYFLPSWLVKSATSDTVKCWLGCGSAGTLKIAVRTVK